MAETLLSYYGDDFTGSTDVMEALTSNGVATVLFLGIPSPAMRQRFRDCRAIGIAGTSRSETPEWMQQQLTPVFEWLKGLGAAICHYKVCSTFDSSPKVGSIGTAIEIGKSVFEQACVPVIVGAPQLGRYTSFGNLFATYQGKMFRIDRHPVMSRHPVTPMDEADLTVHLARQTGLSIALADIATLSSPDAASRIDAMASDAGILFFDVDSPQTQAAAGDHLWRLARKGSRFTAGSSGVEYALLNTWRQQGVIGEKQHFASPGKVERLAVVSGSVSPTTARQISAATADGFDSVSLDPVELVSGGEEAVAGAVDDGIRILKSGRSVILNTALGPSADRGAEIDRIPGARHRLGRSLGMILRQLVEREKLPRAVIAGGDTSSHALRELRVEALTTLLPLPQTPGSPLCLAHGRHGPTDGLQIALKGGQIGTDGYFAQIRDGQGG
ncbi:four-carbon acid sugar kinase family protein [Phyllobacterium sp. 0TCS1.6C]|uniref:four-carbon acid sugar kinase family protein n=1 Tax=unclassified Phyllobacterium TaxID=2638441 RepID=UPI00226492AE|nr:MULTISPECIES: four-carbon acid sugar kinase family protein [unclassified Phyllobacterium]MCX8280111.1 four-carbon acid sugar kinase family protein [Phyllobacterium sp. 0TCS1.6C]MCX8294327.1 four-carbon acid sugar kinase family protein [Phyllobacterium sp. 0TCS1.6A]